MDINRASLDALFRTYSVAWEQGLEWAPPVDLKFLFTSFVSKSKSNFYAWVEMISKFREWTGDRVFHNLRSKTDEIVNQDWEDSFTMPASDIKDEQYPLYANKVEQFSQAWNLLKYEQVINVLINNSTCFTGKAFAANDHLYGDNTIDNLVTDALSETSFNAAFTNSAAWKYSNGVLIRPKWTHLLHGPKLRDTAFNLVDNKYIVADGTAGGTKTNPNFGRCKRVEIPDFTDSYDDYWALIDDSKGIHAVALQIREEVSWLMDTDPAHVARTGQVDFMANGRLATGPTMPHLVYMGRL